MAEDLGRVLAGRYRLSKLLGQGGMGAVWCAHDEQLDREVAVKELRLAEHLDPAQRESWIARAVREARAAARLKHPGIVTVHDQAIGDDGRPWIVMELIRGRSLAELVQAEGPLAPGRVAHIGLQVLDALRAAHRSGITHRDIKPANILLEGERVVLTDFGIAAVEGDVTLTRSGALMGTPAFMSPEQVRGLAATPASDLWSLGATLFTAVEGRPPFTGTNAGAVLVAVATQEPALPVHAGPLTPALGALLRKNPAERPTADQLYTLLAPVTGERQGSTPSTVREPAPPVPIPPPPRPHPSRRGRSALIAAIITVALLLAAGAAATGYVMYGGKDSTYQTNLRAARDLGVPDEFTRTSDTKTGDGRVRVTFVACPAKCNSNVVWKLDVARQWLRSKPSVRQVSGAAIYGCLDAEGCAIPVETYRRPRISNARILAARDGRLLFQIDVG